MRKPSTEYTGNLQVYQIVYLKDRLHQPVHAGSERMSNPKDRLYKPTLSGSDNMSRSEDKLYQPTLSNSDKSSRSEDRLLFCIILLYIRVHGYC